MTLYSLPSMPDTSDTQETITDAAIQFDGNTYLGRRHCQIIRDIVQKTGVKHVPGGKTQGFTTSTGRFVSREEAARIAQAAGQIKRLKYSSKQLFSEEMW